MYGLSVLMSVYYKENPKFFDLALNSILVEQTKMPDEFVLVCDGDLTHDLNDVIKKYEKEFPRVVKVYRLDVNSGLGTALNYGLLKCSYDLVARADSDDICVRERFEQQMQYMNENPDVSVISSYIDEFDEDWNVPFNTKKLPLNHDELVKMSRMRNPLNHMAVMFRKKDVLSVGSYQHMPYTEDYYLWVRIIAAGKKIGNIDKVLVHARVGNGMLGRRSNRSQILGWYEINKYMLDNHMINGFEKMRNMFLIRVFVFMPRTLKRITYSKLLRNRKCRKTMRLYLVII